MGQGLPHRLRNGQCRDCGRLELFSAPDGCTRCALALARAAGRAVVQDPVARLELSGDPAWHQVAADVRARRIQSSRFYLYVGCDSADVLQPPFGAPVADWALPGRRAVTQACADLAARYFSFWVVTTVGCWSAAPPAPARKGLLRPANLKVN